MPATQEAAATHSRLGQVTASASPIKVLFSDLDGTLVHYPKDFQEYATVVAEDDNAGTATIRYNVSGEERVCVMLSSLTGGRAYMSVMTSNLVSRLRSMGVLFVIITGARASTYVQRRQLLPPADYEFYENGGRMLADGKLVPEWTDSFVDQVGPVPDRAGLVPNNMPAPEERTGSLWQLYAKLSSEGWHTDARDYTTNFRVDINRTAGKEQQDFFRSIEKELEPRALVTSFNLGKADIYPKASGKANAAAHILELSRWSPANAIAMFDDDNDIELGSLVGRSFLPGVTHQSVLDAMAEHQGRWTVTKSRGFLGTEEALYSILELSRVQNHGPPN